MQAAAWVVCTTAALIAARNRQVIQHRQWMARSYAVTFTFVSSRVLNLWSRYWSHLGDAFAAVGVIAFTLASLLIVDLGLNWRELTISRLIKVPFTIPPGAKDRAEQAMAHYSRLRPVKPLRQCCGLQTPPPPNCSIGSFNTVRSGTISCIASGKRRFPLQRPI
jgi:hypothetical protein